MEDLQDRIGETHTTIDGFTIEAGKIAEFARAVLDDNPAHYDLDAARTQGFNAVPAPLTFTRIGTFPRYRTERQLDLGFQPEYVLHGEQSYEYERPLLVGDVLTGEARLADVYEREGSRGGAMRFAEVETVYRDHCGERVLAERSIVIRTERAVTESTDRSGTGSESAVSGTTGGDLALNTPCDGLEGSTARPATGIAETTAPDPVDNLELGDTAPTVTVGPLERATFVRYAGASGDFNPIHYDEPYARAAGNPGVFGQGMFTAGVAAQVVADWVGLGRVRTFTVRFRSRVWPGDTIRATAEVTDVKPVTQGERIGADVRVMRDDETVLTGRAGMVFLE